MRIALVLLLFLGGCARGQDHDIHGIDPTFHPYYDKFSRIYGIYVGIPIGFWNLPVTKDAECRIYEDGYRQIAVDPENWKWMSESTREQLVDHELGHCIFNRTHNRLKLSDGCPKSIMNPYTFGEPCFTRHFAEYINELPYAEPGDYL